MRLQSRRMDSALEFADRVLADNPRHRAGLALRAAALAVTSRQEEAAEARARFEEHHPESAVLDRLLGRVLQEHYRFAESIAPLERALVIEPDDEDPLSILAQSLAHLGREPEARAALEEHRERSPYPFPWRENMLEVLRRLEDTVEIETADGFRLRLPPAEREVMGKLLPRQLAAARDGMVRRWSFEPEGEVLVEVFDVHGDFSVRTVGFEGFMALGACFGNVVTLVSPLSEMRGRFLWSQTAVHEFAHVVTLGLSRQRMPRWLSEGVSVVEERKANPEWTRPLERDVLDARANDLIFPIERLDEAFQDGSTVMLGYFLGSLVCEVAERDFGFEALVDLVEGYADGSTTAEVVRRVLGVEPAELDARLLEYIDTVVAGRAAIRPTYDDRGKEALRRRVMAGDTSALVDLAAAYHELGQPADRDATLRRAGERLGDTPALARLRAEIALSEGRLFEARSQLAEWSRSDAVDADGLVQLARIELSQGERDAGLTLLRRARTLFPGDTSPHGAVSMLFQELDSEDDAERDEWLDVVHSICVFDEVAVKPRLILAREALGRDDLDTAIRYYEEVVTIEPYDPAQRLELADLYTDASRIEDAREQWQFVLGMRAGQAPSATGGIGSLQGLLEDDLRDQQEEARQRLSETDDGSR
jgi:tetratricopeptide (TPR) repeat protein